MGKKKTTILVVDSEPQTKKMLEIMLAENQFHIEACTTGKQCVGLCISLKPDIVLLDLNLPDMSGYDVITALRLWSQVPVIIVTARAENKDIVRGLNMGADDYVTKPFNSSVLEARINASLRKGAIQETGEPSLVNGLLRMDLVRHQVYLDETLIPLTPKEYNLLRYLMIHRGKMLTQKQILTEVWGPAHGDDSQYLRVFIGQIRAKIEKDPANPVVITTEPGVGYRMEDAAQTA
ncbi:MAG: response regulator transcription factor [Alphaproteobacteria bacterium]